MSQSEPQQKRSTRVATDVGGTFTDLVYFRQGADGQAQFGHAKTHTTSPNFEQGVLNLFEKANISPRDFDFFAHGTTVVINALLSRTGCKVGLITTRGFRDVLEIGRGNRPDLFNFRFRKPKPFVERFLRLEIDERTDHHGVIEKSPDFSELDEILDIFRSEAVKAIAIVFLHSYVNPENELALTNEIKTRWPDVSVMPSHFVSREWREYERTSSAVLSAYVHPVARRYVDKLSEELQKDGFTGSSFMMQSNGGIGTLRATSKNPITMIESGPASGMLGAMAMGRYIGEKNLLALDIGGTTAKCSLIEDGAAKITTDYKIEWSRTQCGYPIQTPVIEIVEIGNGGGSIAWVDSGAKLHVGPQSAGSMPGPVGYGNGGTEPTTTDAHLMVGRIGEDYFVAGEVSPDMDKVNAAFETLAEKLDSDSVAVALGVIRIANANMTNALKLVSVNKGYDPRDFALLAFGGGGAMHAVALAEEIGAPKVIIPTGAGVFSAWGMLMTDLRRDILRTHLTELKAGSLGTILSVIEALKSELKNDFLSDELNVEALQFEVYFDMRYEGQEHTVKIKLNGSGFDFTKIASMELAFHEAHKKQYDFHLEALIEIVNYHLVGIISVQHPELPSLDDIGPDPSMALRCQRKVLFDDGKWHDTAIYSRERLGAGMILNGPAIVEAADTTALILPAWAAKVDEFGNLFVTRK